LLTIDFRKDGAPAATERVIIEAYDVDAFEVEVNEWESPRPVAPVIASAGDLEVIDN
jgi:hypothetical protein